jgi:23S rRNA (cytidine1920-2'-O)/16S rRNA (cytidine1409-2'-O)-methyltransferase
VREGVNARYLKTEDFESKFDLAVMDVSFISATKVMPAIVDLLKETGSLIVLISGGIVRDPEKHTRVIEEVNHAAEELGLKVGGVIQSPIQGADGNVEFLALYLKGSPNLTHFRSL